VSRLRRHRTSLPGTERRQTGVYLSQKFTN
jgi:hypothetical protein